MEGQAAHSPASSLTARGLPFSLTEAAKAAQLAKSGVKPRQSSVGSLSLSDTVPLGHVEQILRTLPKEPAEEAVFFRLGREKRLQYKVLASLGEGSEGRVRLVETADGRKLAMKSMVKAVQQQQQQTPGTESKAAYIRKLALTIGVLLSTQPNLPHALDYFETESTIYVVWELLACPVPSFVAQHGGKLSEEVAARILAGTLSGLAVLHSVGVIHRDIKTSNLLLREAGDPTSVCLCDFASSRMQSPSSVGPTTNSSSQPPSPTSASSLESTAAVSDDLASLSAATSPTVTAGFLSPTTPSGVLVRSASSNVSITSSLGVGTPMYLSPQCSSGIEATEADDIWSIGAISYEILHGNAPFSGAKSLLELTNRIIEGHMEPLNTNLLSEGARAFITRLMNMEREQRPTAREALQDPWLVEKLAVELEEGFDFSDAVPLMNMDLDQSNDKSSFSFAVAQSNIFGLSGAHVHFDAITGSLRLVGGPNPAGFRPPWERMGSGSLDRAGSDL